MSSKQDEKNNIHYSFKEYVLFFFIFSMLGWVWEVCLGIYRGNGFINRGTMFGPWLPIYGSGGVIMLFLLKRFYTRPVFTFFLGMTISSVIEYITHWFLEVTRGIRWWDYTGYFMNLNGRIYLEGAIVFGLMGCAVIYFVAPALKRFFDKLPEIFTFCLAITLSIFFFIDSVYSTINPNTGKGISTSVIEDKINKK